MIVVERYFVGDIKARNGLNPTAEVVFASDYDALESMYIQQGLNYARDQARIAQLEAELAFQKDLLAKYHKLNCTAETGVDGG